ncbi:MULTISPECIES: hypothetical protein [Streptomyces]|uniref:hypothetical protein n=1 Tax=Streptomyces TaxID=1883 RepID=UPI00296F6CB8|nr:hypothetical protein [Streptomyces californicus]MDW4902155.1 hypothetical protein [Streptomyces californicus]
MREAGGSILGPPTAFILRPAPVRTPGRPPHADRAPDPNTGPLFTDGKTAYSTVRFSVQPSTLDSSYLDGVDQAVRPLSRP